MRKISEPQNARAFHKYEIDETNGCQLYVACESSDVAKHRKNGPLAKTVYHAMRKISEPQNARLYEDDKYLLDLLGRVASSSGNNAGKKKFSWDEKFEEKSFRHIMHQLMSFDNQIIYFLFIFLNNSVKN